MLNKQELGLRDIYQTMTLDHVANSNDTSTMHRGASKFNQ